MRSLSMRIANPHLLPKKGNRFMSYQTKKSKSNKTKLTNSDGKHDTESQSQFLNEGKSRVDTEEASNTNATVRFKLK